MTDIRLLSVWQRAQALALTIHHQLDARTCAQYAPGMRAQLLRAATSIGANLAPRCAPDANALLLRHLAAAITSARELENHLLLASHLGALLGDPQQLLGEVAEIRRMLYALRRVIEAPRGGGGEAHHAPDGTGTPLAG